MAPTKHAATKKPTSKRARTESNYFKSVEVDMKYNDCYKDKTIIMKGSCNWNHLRALSYLRCSKKELGPSC